MKIKNKKRGGKVLIVLSVIAGLIIAAAAFVFLSPWPAVWLLRHGGDGPIDAPSGYEEKTSGVVVRKDLTYTSEYGKNQFDLYLPKDGENMPLILWVHGGAFVAGDKSGLEIWGSLLASEGYAVAAMNYEWAPEASWPAQVIQVSDCLKELQKLSEDTVSLDMSRIFLAGDSAGAHMAAQAAIACFNEDYAQKTGISMPIKKEDLKGALLYCGPYELEAFAKIDNGLLNFFMNKIGQSYVGTLNWQKNEKTQYLNIIPWLTKDCPPVYITDGNSGSFESQGKNLGSALRQLNVSVRERYFPESEGEIPHEYQMQLTSPQGQDCYKDTLEFLKMYSERKGGNNESGED